MQANASMDCGGHVVVLITNDGPAPFHGASATAGSWIVTVNLAPGESTSITALFTSQKSVDGYIQGRYEGDPTFVSVPWHAERACEVPTTPPTTVDTTPQPVPTTGPGQVQMCRVPGSNPPMEVPCDDPRATTPYQPVIPSTTLPAAPGESAVTSAPPEPITTVQAHTAPPVHTLPATGTGTGLELVLAVACASIGTLLIGVTRRRAGET